MSEKDLEMYDEFLNLLSEGDALTGNCILEILDMMDFTSQVIEENKHVQASYRNDSQKSYIESFLMRIKNISNDNGIEREHKAVWFEKGGQAYVLLYSAPLDQFESNLYVFDYILTDIQIN